MTGLSHAQQILGIGEQAHLAEHDFAKDAQVKVRLALSAIGIVVERLPASVVGLNTDSPASMLFPHCHHAGGVARRERNAPRTVS